MFSEAMVFSTTGAEFWPFWCEFSEAYQRGSLHTRLRGFYDHNLPFVFVPRNEVVEVMSAAMKMKGWQCNERGEWPLVVDPEPRDQWREVL